MFFSEVLFTKISYTCITCNKLQSFKIQLCLFKTINSHSNILSYMSYVGVRIVMRFAVFYSKYIFTHTNYFNIIQENMLNNC